MHALSVPVIFLVALALILPFIRKQPSVMLFAIVNFLIFIYMLATGFFGLNRVLYLEDLALQPASMASRPHTIITHAFLHGGLLHILGNTIFLVLFGMPLEARIGSRRIAIIYIASGLFAGLGDSLASFGVFGDIEVYRVGASGAIFGIMGAYLALFPRDEVLMPLGFIFMKAPVWVGVLIYGGFETFLVLTARNDGIGHMAHASGLFSGLILAPIIAGNLAGRKVISIADLRRIARTERMKGMLRRIDHEDIPDIRDAWIDKLVSASRCPDCGKGLVRAGDHIHCEACEFDIRYARRSKGPGLKALFGAVGEGPRK